MQTFRLTQWVTSCCNEECEIVVRCIDATFHIRWLSEDLADASSLLTWYHQSVQTLKGAGDSDEPEPERDADIVLAHV